MRSDASNRCNIEALLEGACVYIFIYRSVSMLNEFQSSLEKALHLNKDWKSLESDWRGGRFPITASGTQSPWMAYVFSNLAALTEGNLLIVTPDENDARALLSDLNLFTEGISLFPWWGTMLYRGISPRLRFLANAPPYWPK